MPDDMTQRGGADRSRIALNEEHEVRYWTKELGVPEDRLKRAVAAVGPSVSKVRAYLERPQATEPKHATTGATSRPGVQREVKGD